MQAVIEVDRLRKSFRIPSVERRTIREHVFGLLQPRTFEPLTVLDGISFRVERGKPSGSWGETARARARS